MSRFMDFILQTIGWDAAKESVKGTAAEAVLSVIPIAFIAVLILGALAYILTLCKDKGGKELEEVSIYRVKPMSGKALTNRISQEEGMSRR